MSSDVTRTVATSLALRDPIYLCILDGHSP